MSASTRSPEHASAALQQLEHTLQSSLALVHAARQHRPALPPLGARDSARSAFAELGANRAYQRQLDALLQRMGEQLESTRRELLYFQARRRAQLRPALPPQEF